MTGILRQRDTDLSYCVFEKKGVDWPQVFEPDSNDPANLSSQLSIRNIPSIWVVDRDGMIMAAHIGVDELPGILAGFYNH